MSHALEVRKGCFSDFTEGWIFMCDSTSSGHSFLIMDDASSQRNRSPSDSDTFGTFIVGCDRDSRVAVALQIMR